ncbi:DUF1488 domain-containing protein [Methylobacterium mesophilicum SR1.6/6]|uniref:DUF1488 domain-containing protein n=1 Tax=Methylobacterium mesophilicum SR1.6/6 TaxID=908290 RepID=A0A6B9FEI6_9HYPH|nr:DUF1488 family protein [Methylobacterium mesophilicum]QGY01491.1 DUF1488 domain-containing protein [Methylobacterium mesophilicum SR1.6/6]
MALESYAASGSAVIDQETGAHVRFAMLDGDALVPCRVTFEALHHLFAVEGQPFDPLDLFHRYHLVVEDAAAEKYEREGAQDGWIHLDDPDFG